MVNKGLLETWYYAENDFNTLLKKDTVGYYITEPNIFGKMNYSLFNKLFFEYKLNDFLFTFSFIQAKDIQYMEVNGTNVKNRFLLDLVYYYTNNNILMKEYLKSYNYKGKGGSFDIEYKKRLDEFDFYIGFFNILGFIDWKNIMKMVYHFDSDTKYIGEDGYYHYRPFGTGKFVKTKFFQRIPFYIKYKLTKKFHNGLIVGDSGMYCNKRRYDEIFFIKNFLKIGYVIQNKNFLYGINFKNFSIEISNNLELHSKFIKISFNYKFK
ncbi:hypothetical protein [Nautilia sp.]